MTEEEMAENYVKEEKYVCRWDMEQTELDEIVKEAYLAGLKAGKDMNISTKWHDLREETE